MILANKNGLLIACKLIDSTENHWIVKAHDEFKNRKIAKRSPNWKLFNGVSSAEKWIKGDEL